MSDNMRDIAIAKLKDKLSVVCESTFEKLDKAEDALALASSLGALATSILKDACAALLCAGIDPNRFIFGVISLVIDEVEKTKVKIVAMEEAESHLTASKKAADYASTN